MAKVSVKAAARGALAEEKKLAGKPILSAPTRDSFINFSQGIGLGAGNGLAGGTYGFRPITRNRILMEWIHRGSWIGGMAVDVIGDDMTRKGVDMVSDMKPDDAQRMDAEAQRLGVWDKINDAIKWGRLYGGSICVALIDGQDPRTPLNIDTIAPDQFKGLITFDRWMLTPELGDLVTDYGPHLGQPKYYRVQDNAPALRGASVHYTRVMVRHVGVALPYQQALTENLWGISIYERFYDRMVGFDTASMGAAQLVTKAYLRTLKVKDLRQIVASGGLIMEGLTSYVQMMCQYQGNEGITLIDAEDEFEVQQTSAFSGVGDVILQLAQQVSGALGIPLVRLLGQSPAGLNSTGESDWRNYYDNIAARQNKDLGEGVPTIYKLIGRSLGLKLPDDFTTTFRPLLEMSEKEKAEIAKTVGEAVGAAKDAGLLGTKSALKELKQSSSRTGVFSNITEEQIEAADDELPPPMSESLLGEAESAFGGGGFGGGDAGKEAKLPDDKEGDNGKTRPNGKAATVDARPRRRVQL